MRRFLLFVTMALGSLGVGTAPATLAAAPAATQTVTLAVDNMTCAACPITVRKALEKVPGVSRAKVALKTKTATVAYDPTKAKVDDLIWATTEAGYPSRPMR